MMENIKCNNSITIKGSFKIFGQFEFMWEDIDMVEPWYFISIEETKAVCSTGFCIGIIAIKSVIFWVVRVSWYKGQVRYVNTADNIMVLHKCGFYE